MLLPDDAARPISREVITPAILVDLTHQHGEGYRNLSIAQIWEREFSSKSRYLVLVGSLFMDNTQKTASFKQTYAAKFAESKEIEVQKLAAEYHERTEAFDRTVCTGPIKYGRIQPANYYEYQKCAKNARSERQRVNEQAARAGIRHEDLGIAIRMHRFMKT